MRTATLLTLVAACSVSNASTTASISGGSHSSVGDDDGETGSDGIVPQTSGESSEAGRDSGESSGSSGGESGDTGCGCPEPPPVDDRPNPRFVMWDKNGEPVRAMAQSWQVAIGETVDDSECAWLAWVGDVAVNAQIDLATGGPCATGTTDPPAELISGAPYTLTLEY